jgi:hypothetical protein
VSDISVSRCHALVKYNTENGKFYLEDNLSKFGTLVLSKGSIELEPEMTKAVQIGRSVISFTVKPFVASALQMTPQPQIAQSKTIEKEFQTPSPQKQQPAENSKKQIVEELLRQKIEETNNKID